MTGRALIATPRRLPARRARCGAAPEQGAPSGSGRRVAGAHRHARPPARHRPGPARRPRTGGVHPGRRAGRRPGPTRTWSCRRGWRRWAARCTAVPALARAGSSTRSTPARPARRRRWAAACATSSASPASDTGSTVSAIPGRRRSSRRSRRRATSPGRARAARDYAAARLPFPNVDFAIAALAERYRMVDEAGEVLFAVARTAGWLAHAAEEYRHSLRFRPAPPTPAGTGTGLTGARRSPAGVQRSSAASTAGRRGAVDSPSVSGAR